MKKIKIKITDYLFRSRPVAFEMIGRHSGLSFPPYDIDGGVLDCLGSSILGNEDFFFSNSVRVSGSQINCLFV